MSFFEEQAKAINSSAEAEGSEQVFETDSLTAGEIGETEAAEAEACAETLSDAQRLFWDRAKLPKKKRKVLPIGVCVLVILICVCVGLYFALNFILGEGWLKNAFTDDTGVSLTLKEQPKPEVDDEYVNSDGSYTVEGVAQAAKASVVAITCYGENEDDSTAYTYTGQGSGVIITADGYIVTNAHVIAVATKGIKVTDSDGNEYEAKVIGSDSDRDIAVIKVSGEFTPAEIGDSLDVEVGEQVVAIGNPGGYAGTVTSGIVSGTDRLVKSTSGTIRMSCLQIDAAINPGSSGGGLFNMFGQLVGITSSKLSSDSYDGIGFAISTNAVVPIVESIIENGYAEARPIIGITFYAVSETVANMYGTPAGLYVQSVQENSNAYGILKAGDVITALDGEKTADTTTVTKLMETKSDGDSVEVTYRALNDDGSYADEQTITVNLISGESSEFVEE